MSEEHESFIKTPKQLITVVVLSFVVPVLIIVLLVKYVGAGARSGAGADAMTAEAIEARIQPVAKFELAAADAAGAAGAAGGADKGKALYDAACTACHSAGVAGAPKLGDKAAWAPRIKTGTDALVGSVLKGKGAMPPKGGSSASDADIRAAVDYMVAASK